MLKVGLTGGVGCGKSFVAEIMKKKGIPVFDADCEAKKLYLDSSVVAEVRNLFGNAVFDDDKLNFGKLAQLVFNNHDSLIKLNGIIHPIVRQNFINWAENQNCNIVAMESALLFETGLCKMFDKIITVDAPEELRISRIKKRNPDWSEEEIRHRMASQMPQSEKCNLADFVITNDDNSDLESQIKTIKKTLECIALR